MRPTAQQGAAQQDTARRLLQLPSSCRLHAPAAGGVTQVRPCGVDREPRAGSMQLREASMLLWAPSLLLREAGMQLREASMLLLAPST